MASALRLSMEAALSLVLLATTSAASEVAVTGVEILGPATQTLNITGYLKVYC